MGDACKYVFFFFFFLSFFFVFISHTCFPPSPLSHTRSDNVGQHLRTLTSLRRLSLVWCTALTDKALESLDALPYLNHLGLRSLYNVVGRGFEHLARLPCVVGCGIVAFCAELSYSFFYLFTIFYNYCFADFWLFLFCNISVSPFSAPPAFPLTVPSPARSRPSMPPT